MADLTGPLHVAISAALTAGSPPAIARVYDLGNVPTVPTYPYVVIGEYFANDAGDKGDGTDGGDADDFAQVIHVWGRDHRGKKQVEDLMALVYAALHRASLVLTGSPLPGRVVTCRCAYKQVFLDADGLTMHGVMRFEGYVHTA